MAGKVPFCCPKLLSLWTKDSQPQKPKSVNIFVGFFFVINLCFSTGFLSIPYVFFYAGYLAAIPTLLLIAFSAWNGARWELEIMARAQVCWFVVNYEHVSILHGLGFWTDINIIKTHSINSCVSTYWTDIKFSCSLSRFLCL